MNARGHQLKTLLISAFLALALPACKAGKFEGASGKSPTKPIVNPDGGVPDDPDSGNPTPTPTPPPPPVGSIGVYDLWKPTTTDKHTNALSATSYVHDEEFYFGMYKNDNQIKIQKTFYLKNTSGGDIENISVVGHGDLGAFTLYENVRPYDLDECNSLSVLSNTETCALTIEFTPSIPVSQYSVNNYLGNAYIDLTISDTVYRFSIGLKALGMPNQIPNTFPAQIGQQLPLGYSDTRLNEPTDLTFFKGNGASHLAVLDSRNRDIKIFNVSLAGSDLSFAPAPRNFPMDIGTTGRQMKRPLALTYSGASDQIYILNVTDGLVGIGEILVADRGNKTLSILVPDKVHASPSIEYLGSLGRLFYIHRNGSYVLGSLNPSDASGVLTSAQTFIDPQQIHTFSRTVMYQTHYFAAVADKGANKIFIFPVSSSNISSPFECNMESPVGLTGYLKDDTYYLTATNSRKGLIQTFSLENLNSCNVVESVSGQTLSGVEEKFFFPTMMANLNTHNSSLSSPEALSKLAFSDTFNHNVKVYDVSNINVTRSLIGIAGGYGHVNGSASSSKFRHVRQVIYRNSTNSLLALDRFNRTVRKITSDGQTSDLFTFSHLYPLSMAVDSTHMYFSVTDCMDYRLADTFTVPCGYTWGTAFTAPTYILRVPFSNLSGIEIFKENLFVPYSESSSDLASEGTAFNFSRNMKISGHSLFMTEQGWAGKIYAFDLKGSSNPDELATTAFSRAIEIAGDRIYFSTAVGDGVSNGLSGRLYSGDLTKLDQAFTEITNGRLLLDPANISYNGESIFIGSELDPAGSTVSENKNSAWISKASDFEYSNGVVLSGFGYFYFNQTGIFSFVP